MNNETHTLSGAYALDALEPQEAAEFHDHLQACQACRDEVRELRKAAARMAELDAIAPPPELKRRVLDAVDRTPQQPPARPAEGTPPVVSAVEPGPRRWMPRLLAAAAAVLVIGGGLWAVDDLRTDPEPALTTAAQQVFGAEDVRTVTVETANGGKLKVAVSPERNEMAVDTRELPELDDEHVYQIWAVHGTEMTSAAVLEDIDDGAAMGMPGEDTQVAFTIEPLGGSEEPTTDPIVVVDPSALA